MLNLFEMEAMLEEHKGKEYATWEALVNCEEEHQRILEARKKEFDSLPNNIKPRYTEKSFPYRNMLEMKQTYIINGGEATIETSIFPLPLNENISVVSVSAYSDADISGYDKSWKVARERIAKECGDLEIAAVNGKDVFRKEIQYKKILMEGIFNVRKAGITLKTAKEKVVEDILAKGRFQDEAQKLTG